MKTAKNILFLSILFLTSCGKSPQASFTVSNTTPWPGEQVTLTNTSTNSLDQTWEIDAGIFSTIESPVVVYPTSGPKVVHLTVYRRNKKSYADQTINVRQAGNVVFWTDNANWTADGGYQIDVTIGTTTHTITNFITIVQCGAAYSANFQLAPGTYPYSAAQHSPGILTWSGNVTITDAGCANVHL